MQHDEWMDRALELARRGTGQTSPNPMVGAVVVRSGRVIGEGYHARAGADHAEVMALAAAGPDAGGADLYVTLEPCNHVGRTPPCTEAIIQAGIRRVHYAMADPNTGVSSGGHARLVAAGIDVRAGLRAEAARELNRFWIKRITSGRAWVVAKFASSIDGRIATAAGESRWITGSDARAEAHRIRAEVDAVLVGAGTAVADDPALTVRTEGHVGRQPLRVVLDPTGRVPLSARLFRDGAAPTLVVTTTRMPDTHRTALGGAGVEVLTLDGDEIPLAALLTQLGGRGVSSVLVEGGSDTLGRFFDQRLVDEVAAFVAPCIIGGTSALSPVGGTGIGLMSQAQRIDRPRLTALGDDWLIRGRLVSTQPA